MDKDKFISALMEFSDQTEEIFNQYEIEDRRRCSIVSVLCGLFDEMISGKRLADLDDVDQILDEVKSVLHSTNGNILNVSGFKVRVQLKGYDDDEDYDGIIYPERDMAELVMREAEHRDDIVLAWVEEV